MSEKDLLAFFFKFIDQLQEFSREAKDAIKDATSTLFFKKRENLSKKSLLNSIIRLVVALGNPWTLNINSILEQYLLQGNTDKEIKMKLQNLVAILFQKFSPLLSQSKGLQCAMDVAQQGITFYLSRPQDFGMPHGGPLETN